MFSVVVCYCWGQSSNGHEKLKEDRHAAETFDDCKRIIADQLLNDCVRNIRIQTEDACGRYHTVTVVDPLISYSDLLEMTYGATTQRGLKQTTLF